MHTHSASQTWLTIVAVPTPFAADAFHPVDGFAQSIPYHLFVFLFPMHRLLYLGIFGIVNFWAIFVSVPSVLVFKFLTIRDTRFTTPI
jgi:lathosterol oxidase